MSICVKCEQDCPDVDFIVRHKGAERIDTQCHACRNKRAAASRLRRGKKPNPRPRHIPENHRRCSRCKIVKVLEEFHRSSHQCKECTSEICRAYYLRKTEDILKRSRAYYANNKEAHLARCKDWQKRHPEKAKERSRIGFRRYKARKRNAPVIESVSLQVVYERDHGICSLCHKKVKRQDASVDHIVPLSKGGNHTYQNCTLAHTRCNSRKNNRTVVQQMRLF